MDKKTFQQSGHRLTALVALSCLLLSGTGSPAPARAADAIAGDSAPSSPSVPSPMMLPPLGPLPAGDPLSESSLSRHSGVAPAEDPACRYGNPTAPDGYSSNRADSGSDTSTATSASESVSSVATEKIKISALSTVLPGAPMPGGTPVPGGSPGALLPGIPVGAYPVENGVIVVDSDPVPATPTASGFVWNELDDAPDRVHIAKGTEFPVASICSLSSKTARVGDRVEARLKVDVRIGGRLIAARGSLVVGHVTSAHPARRLLTAEMMPKRWMRANGALGLQFDEIITPGNERLPLVGVPAKRGRIINNKHAGRVLGVNKHGQITSPLSIQLKHQGVHLAVRGAAAAGGVFTMGAVPVIFGVLGAVDPSFAFMHPVGHNVRHRRLKGFGMGVLSGLPGGFIVADFLIRGVEAEIKPGDEFLVTFRQDFTGEKATSARLIPGATTKVKGEVLTKPGKSRSKSLPARSVRQTKSANPARK